MTFRRTLIVFVLFNTFGAVAQTALPAVQQGQTPAITEKLRRGGPNIFFRHGRTRRQNDPAENNADDPLPTNCAVQRNLSEQGVAQIRAIGLAFAAFEFPVGVVRASPLCRCYECALHAFGRYQRDRNLMLNVDTPEGDVTQARPWQHSRNLGKVPPAPLTKTVFVSHNRIVEFLEPMFWKRARR